MQRKYGYANMIASDEAEFREIGCYSAFHPDVTKCSSMDDVSASQEEEDQNFPEYCRYGAHEQLLSDHASVDMLILDKELRNALSDLEKLGISEDDYRSLALTKEEDDEEEKVDDSHGTWHPHVVGQGESDVKKSGGILEHQQEDDWEVLSSAADSVWTAVEVSASKRSSR